MISGGEAQRIKLATANAKTCAASLSIGDTRQATELLRRCVGTPDLCVIYGFPELELSDYVWCPMNPSRYHWVSSVLHSSVTFDDWVHWAAVSLGLRPTPSPAPVFSLTATMGDVY